jgi:hypothetical protein
MLTYTCSSNNKQEHNIFVSTTISSRANCHNAIMGYEMGNAMIERTIERYSLLRILAKQVCGYLMSRGC